MSTPYSRIRTSDETNFPLTKKQREAFNEVSSIVVTLNQAHATMDIQVKKEYTVDLYGSNRSLVTVTVTKKMTKRDGSTVVTLERKRRG